MTPLYLHSPDPAAAPPAPPWLLLVHQLPARPSRVRVKTWRRLQKLGALALKNSVYVLPYSAQAREDFEWVKAEIVAMNGQATVFAVEGADALTSYEIAAAFRQARQQDYDALRREGEKLLAGCGRRHALIATRRQRLERKARLLRQRWNEIGAVDFFQAPGRDEAAATLDEIERALEGAGVRRPRRLEPGGVLMAEKFSNRVWVTRSRPGVDRMSSAWLIRRFIDPRGRFEFAEKPADGSEAVPFDMYGVEFSHHGNQCTFETLAERFAIRAPAVEWLGRIVHDLDLKDDRYAVPESAAVGRMVDGLRQMIADDNELLERGITMFEALYRSFTGQPATPARREKAAPRRRSASSATTPRS